MDECVNEQTNACMDGWMDECMMVNERSMHDASCCREALDVPDAQSTQHRNDLFFPLLETQAHLVVQLSLARMLHLLGCTVQLLVLGSDLITARLVVLAQASIVCLQAPDFRLQAGNLSRELGVLQRPLAIGWNCPYTPTALGPLQHCVAALALVPE